MNITDAAIDAASLALHCDACTDDEHDACDRGDWARGAKVALEAALPHLAAIPTPSVIAVATIAAMALREAADALDAYDAKNAPPTDDRWTCDLGYYGEAEWLRDRAEQMLGALPRIARGYEIRPSGRGGHSVYIDGVEVPYCLAAPGPRIETRGAGLSILWLPVWAETPSPEVGPPPDGALPVEPVRGL